jgi:hypothetical protein
MKKQAMVGLILAVLLSVGVVYQVSADERGECHKMGRRGGEQCPMKKGCQMEEGSPCPIAGAFNCLSGAAMAREKELGLSAEQTKAIRSLQLEVKKMEIRQMAEMKMAMLDMQAKMQEEPFDAEGVKAMMDQGMSSMMASGKQMVDNFAKLKSVFTPEQLAKLKAGPENE